MDFNNAPLVAVKSLSGTSLPFLPLQFQKQLAGIGKVAPVVITIMHKNFLTGLYGSCGNNEYPFFPFAGLDFIVCVVSQATYSANATGIIGKPARCPRGKKCINTAVFCDEYSIALVSFIGTAFAFGPGYDFALVFAYDIAALEFTLCKEASACFG